MLPLSIASDAIDKGWAELHPVARRGAGPPTLVMLYGPRDEAELEVVWRLVQTSYAFARGEVG
jgi:phospholipase/carboxylesterase